MHLVCVTIMVVDAFFLSTVNKLQITSTLFRIAKLSSEETAEATLCRDRLGYFTSEHFRISACSLCYFYLILNSPQFTLNARLRVRNFHSEPYYLIKSRTFGENITVFPTPENQTTMDFVCATLGDEDCTRWTSCCESARKCCDLQITRKKPPGSFKYCPQTFDGWSCWNFTPVNETSITSCPTFLGSGDNGKSSNYHLIKNIHF